MKTQSFISLLMVISLSFVSCSGLSGDEDVITIDVADKGASIPESLYGIFFEEITHSGDGGLYAEMIINRGFEDGNLPSGTVLHDGFACAAHKHCYSNDSINRFKVDWKDFDAMNGWKVECKDGTTPVYKIVTDNPLHSATPHSLCIYPGETSQEIRVINSGYWGMAIEKGKKYDVEFYFSGSTGLETPEIALINEAGEPKTDVSQAEIKPANTPGWNHFTATLTARETAGNLRFMLGLQPKKPVCIDYVSLFPQETFNGRKNGLRKDVAQILADLKPGFVRWPGGCIVEGLTMENRVKWKETIGDPVTRPGEYNLWGYRSTYGFGYHEFLQFCEDIGSEGMFVCNAGMSCLFRNGDYVSSQEVDELIQEALDAIEYAIGGPDTEWGRVRAANGHPEPFPLKYVEIGNENIGSRYAANYNRFHKAIKANYPQLTLITALMFSKNIEELDEVEIIDPHYYEGADWFYNNADVYDKLPDNLPYKVYVGEYAAIGRPALYSSLAEAAFLTGVERNADKIQLVSYAPLIENAGHGKDHLLVLNTEKVYGRTNYWVMKMFSDHRPDVNLHIDITGKPFHTPVSPVGFVGLSTGNTASQFKDFEIIKEGKTVYKTDWKDLDSNWHIERGEWKVEGDVLTQPAPSGDALIWLKDHEIGDCTIKMKALKLQGYEGFRIVFGGKDEKHYFMADMGSHTNESVLFREIGDKGSVSLFDYRNQEPVHADRWYDVRVEIKGNHWQCFMDGELKYEYKYADVRKNYVVSGYDEAKNEVIVKLVNGENVPWKTNIQLLNAGQLANQGTKIELKSESPDDENSFEYPERIVPVSEPFSITGSKMEYTCAPNSFTILRIPVLKP